MKKILTTLFVMCMMIFPMIANATEELTTVNLDDYNTMGLIETLESEEIKVKLDGYKETDDQVTVYLFRGSGCAYCKAFLNFLNDLPAEYYNKIKLVSFDAWYDEPSAILLTNISTYLGEEAGGVPYIIIGKEVFPGYAETYNDGIKAAIDEQYKASERIDVIDDYNKYVEDTKRAEATEKYIPVAINSAVTIVCTIIIIFYVSYSNSRLLYQLKGGDTAYTSWKPSYNEEESEESEETVENFDEEPEEDYSEDFEEDFDEEFDNEIEEELEEVEFEEEDFVDEEETEEIEEVEETEEEIEEEVEETPVVKNNNNKNKNNKKNTHKNKKSKRR